MPLRRPCPLPPRFRRPVHPSVRRFVERRHHRQRAEMRQRWLRPLRRLHGKVCALRWCMLPLGYVALALTIVLLFFLLLFSPWTKVQEIRVLRHDPRVDIARIQQALSPIFGRRMLLLGRSDILPLLQTSLPDFQDASIDVAYPSRLIIRVTLDALAARIRIDEDELPTQSGALLDTFLTEEGISMHYPPAHVPHASTLPLLHITDWGVHPASGDQILPKPFLAALQKTEESLERDFGQEVTERRWFLRAREFHLRTAEWWMWFDLRTSPEEHLQRYRLFLQNVSREHVQEYVDLRPTDRVVYR